LKELKKAFESMDKNGDGRLNKQEMFEGLSSLGLTDVKEFEMIFKEIDVDENGTIE